MLYASFAICCRRGNRGVSTGVTGKETRAALVGGPVCGIAFGAILTVCCRDKHKRRALCKVMRDSFQWVDETVNLFNDFGDSFYFTTESGFPSNGGLVLFENTYDGHKGLCYQVCT